MRAHQRMHELSIFKPGIVRRVFTILVLVTACLLAAGYPASAQSPPNEALQRQLLEQVEAAIPWADAHVEVKKLRLSGTLPKEGWRLEVVEPRTWRDRVRAKVIPDAGGRPIWVSASLSIEVTVWVSAEQTERDEPVRYVEERRLVDRLPHDAVRDVRMLEGQVARASIRAGRVLRESMLHSPQLVARGQVVVVRVRRGSVEVTDRGLAMQSGRAGEVVRVQSASTQRVLTGVVRADGSVELP